ncbi:hypothetical protein OAA38_00825 [bacterium]|nr:hypothetical protein [bacterium]
MANPSTRQGLIDYCLRKLGAPVIEINVDDDQLEDRVDEALQFYREYNSDALVKTYLKHLVTSDDVTNKYISVNDNILFVQRIFPINSGLSSSSFFGLKYQISLNDIYDLNTYVGDLAYYEQMQQYVSLIDMKLTGAPLITFSRNQNRIYIHGEFENKTIKANDYIVFETYQQIDPNTHTDIYNDISLKEYLTQLIKQQWGANLIKFEGMQLPGGVQLNGRQLYDDATQELEKLREQMRLTHELPVDFFLG